MQPPAAHLASVQSGLQLDTQTDDPLHQLRQALTPLASPAASVAPSTSRRPRAARRDGSDPADPAPAYLGALL